MPGVIQQGISADDLSAALAGKADASTVPVASTATPSTEATAGAAGNDLMKFAQQGHQHPRLTSTTMAVLASDATVNIVFTRTFTAKPGVVLTEIDATAAQPLVCVVTAYQQNAGGLYTGCTIKGYRSQALPTQNQLTLASLLTGVINGVNLIASTLTGFNIFGGSAAGASVSVVAIARSDA